MTAMSFLQQTIKKGEAFQPPPFLEHFIKPLLPDQPDARRLAAGLRPVAAEGMEQIAARVSAQVYAVDVGRLQTGNHELMPGQGPKVHAAGGRVVPGQKLLAPFLVKIHKFSRIWP